MPDRTGEITMLLHAIERGERHAANDLLPLIYDELRSHAGKLMSSERRDHTLQRTALVHEAYVKLVRPGVSFESRLHFFNAAAQAMRRILIDHAAAKNAQKRGGGMKEVSLDDVDPAGEGTGVDLLALDEALERLKSVSPRQAQIVMLRFFAGLKDAEVAEMMNVSEKTVRRDWQTARLWLYAEMKK